MYGNHLPPRIIWKWFNQLWYRTEVWCCCWLILIIWIYAQLLHLIVILCIDWPNCVTYCRPIIGLLPATIITTILIHLMLTCLLTYLLVACCNKCLTLPAYLFYYIYNHDTIPMLCTYCQWLRTASFENWACQALIFCIIGVAWCQYS